MSEFNPVVQTKQRFFGHILYLLVQLLELRYNEALGWYATVCSMP